MKRLACLLLALCLLLCGCAGTPEETQPTSPPVTDPTDPPPTDPTDPTDPVPTEPDPTEPTEPEVLYRNPLNGQPLDAPWNDRATAVVINNIEAALPQYGISQADIIYELETEGGITRLLAIFSDLSDVSAIGPVRSARTFFNNIALSHDAMLVHCGGSQFALNGQYADNTDTISNWVHLNEQYNGSYFYRDSQRRSEGYAYEHTLFTTGELLQKAMDKKGYAITYEGNGYDHGLTFADAPELTGESAATVTVKFRGKKTTTMTYNADTGLYAAAQYDQPLMDGGTGKQVAFRNVLVLYTDQWFKSDAYYSRSFYDLSGSGEGHFFCDGKVIPIRWQRDKLRGSFTYTLTDGTPLTLGMGTTYVGIVSATQSPVSYQ